MIGSNSTALRQHAYSVFTASRRERESQSEAPESVRRPQLSEAPRLERALPTRLVEAKTAGQPRTTESRSPAGAMQESSARLAEPTEHRMLARPPEATVAEPTQEEIRRRAYEIFEARGSTPGNDVADWLRAEAELRHQRGLA